MSVTVIIKPGDPDFYDNAKHERDPAGHIVIDGKEVAQTLQCVHCGKHWVSIRGSGKLRGFCQKCMGPLCGSPDCMTRCEPTEKKLEALEKADQRSRW